MTDSRAIYRDDRKSFVTGGLVGLAVGDALGVPVEFQSRESLDRNPVSDMRVHGTHDQPAGTWSDDTSLTLCLVESLCESGIDYHDQAKKFAGWLLNSEWTPHGEVFDVGNATRQAIFRLDAGIEPTEAGPTSESSCGNGSLMRILPIALYLAFADQEERIETTMKCSRLTHGHARCRLACVLFVEIAAAMVRGIELHEAVSQSQRTIEALIDQHYADEASSFGRLISPGIEVIESNDISGGGYVIHCLESSLWCALRASGFRDGVLTAVNLGEDTDTTGAVTGGLLGLLYGSEGIPAEWIEVLARKNDILELAKRFEQVCRHRWEKDK